MTIDELLTQLEREAALGWHDVSQPQPYDQAPAVVVARRLESMRQHPSAS